MRLLIDLCDAKPRKNSKAMYYMVGASPQLQDAVEEVLGQRPVARLLLLFAEAACGG